MPKRSRLDLSVSSKRRRTFVEDEEDEAGAACSLLRTAGLRPIAGGSSFELTRELPDVQQRIAKAFEAAAEEAWGKLDAGLRKDSFFLACLAPLECATGVTQPPGGARAFSVLRCLLDCPLAQEKLSNLLIEAVVAFNEGLRGGEGSGEATAGRILAQFRWVLFPASQDVALVRKCLDLLEALSDSRLEHDLISLLPEVATSPAAVALASDHLRNLLLSDPRQQLATAVFDALTEMPLGDSDRKAVRETAMDLLDSCPVSALPIMVKYLLQSAPCSKVEEREKLCTELRRRFDWDCFALTPLTTSTPAAALSGDCESEEHASAAVLTGDVLRVHCTFQRGLADAWVRVISDAEGSDAVAHAASDFLVLLVLQPLAKARAAEAVVRLRARSGALPAGLLPALFKKHRALVKAHFPALLATAQALLPPSGSSDRASEFAASIYFEAYAALPSFYQQEVVVALVTHVGSSRGPEADAAFETLAKMAAWDPARLQPFAVFIKSLFDSVEVFTCDQARHLYAILSCLAFRSGQDSALKEELHILVRKQLAHAAPFYRSLGVIGAVSMLQYLVAAENGSDASSFASSGLSSGSSAPPPPTGANREVVRLLRLVRASYSQTPALGNLFMDELFGLLSRNVLDAAVEAWIADNTVRDFQNDFVVDNALPPAAGDRWQLRYALDKDSACSIAINLGPLWLGPSSGVEAPSRSVSALCLAPHFRLLCFTERRAEPSSQGNLGDIDGLLGAPVLLPKDFERRPALLALLANYLTEALNGFCRLSSDEMRAKLLWRLGHLVAVRARLLEALAEAGAREAALTEGGRPMPWHSLPRVMYEAGSDWTLEGSVVRVVKKPTGASKGKKKKKKKKGKRGALQSLRAALAAEEEETQEAGEKEAGRTQASFTEARTTGAAAAKQHVDLASLRLCCREMDLEVHRMLAFRPVCIVDMESLSSSLETESQVELGLPELAFLVADLRSKVAFRLGEKPKGLAAVFSRGPREALFHRHLCASRSEADLARFLCELAPALCDRLRTCVAFLRGEAGGPEDSLMPDAASGPGLAARSAFLGILDVLRLLCEWLTRPANQEEGQGRLASVLRAIAGEEENEESEENEEEEGALAQTGAKRLSGFLDAVPDVHVALALLLLLKKLSALARSEEAQNELHERSLELLNRDWDASCEHEGQKYREALLALIEVHFEAVGTGHRAAFLKDMAEHLRLVVDDGGRCAAYSTLTRQTFPVFYRAALTLALQVVRFAHAGPAPSDRKLARWKQAVDVMTALMQLLRKRTELPNVASFLPVGKQFVQAMLSHAMPLLDEVFVARQEEVTSLLKQIQQITRFLQHLCVFCKGQGDGGLARHVPHLKRLLESFIYRVKVMLSSNHCGGAFWLGNLKNRDLQGQEIRSEEEEEEEEAEEDEGEGDASGLGSLSGSDPDSDSGSVSASY